MTWVFEKIEKKNEQEIFGVEGSDSKTLGFG